MGLYDDFDFTLILNVITMTLRLKMDHTSLNTKSDIFSYGHGVKRTVCYVMIESTDNF